MLVIRDYNNGILEEFMFQYDIVRSILERGTTLDIDSVISATENNWAVQTFSLATYIFSFTEFYDPDFKLYKSSVTDGSIRIVKDET